MSEPAGTTTSRRPREVVADYLDAFARRDVEACLALLTEDVVWRVDGDHRVPTVGIRRGREQVREWIECFPHHFDPRGWTVSAVLDGSAGPDSTSSGDHTSVDVVVLGWFRYGIRTTGHPTQGEFAMRMRVRGQQISRYQIFEDSHALSLAFTDPATGPGGGAGAEARVGPTVRDEVSVNGTVYAFDDTGEGPVMVFAHGLFVDRTLFAPQVRALAGRRRCIVVDMPGHGRSGRRAHGWSLEEVTDDLALMIAESSWGPVTFVGHSQGGMIGIRLAARYPELVCGLGLLSTTARAEPGDRHPAWRARQHALAGTAEQRTAMLDELQTAITSHRWRRDQPGQAAAELAVMTAHHPDGLIPAIDAAVLDRADVRDLLPDIAAPTVIVAGELDQATPVDHARELAAGITGSELVLLPDTAHHSPWEDPHGTTRALERLIELTGSPRRA